MQLVALGVVLYATGPVLARSSDTSGVLLSFWRLWFGVGVFGLASLVMRLTGRTLGSRRGVALGALAGAMFSLNQVLFFTAIKRTSVIDASLMSTLAPIVVALAAVPLFGERPGARFRLFSLVAIAGAAFLITAASSGPEGDPVGMLMALVSMILFAGFFVVSKLSRSEISVVGFLTTAICTAAVFVTGYTAALGLDPSTVEAPDLWRALFMATVPGALGHVVMTMPLNYLPANVPPLFRLAGPFLSGLFAWVTLGDQFTWVHVIGGAVIVAGQAGAIMSKAGQDLIEQARISQVLTAKP